jgi:hypothetical protein
MGLDQNAYRIKKGIIKSQIPSPKDVPNDDSLIEIQYWRKHPNLQGWMQRLYEEKGGSEQFNCRFVQLTTEDLNRLEDDIRNKKLPETNGFFYGDDADEYYRHDDLLFIANAKLWIEEGFDILYDSWW